MPASLRLRFGVLASVQLAAVALATRAYAAPGPTTTPTPTPTPSASNNPCDLLIGPAKQFCERGDGNPGGAPAQA